MMKSNDHTMVEDAKAVGTRSPGPADIGRRRRERGQSTRVYEVIIITYVFPIYVTKLEEWPEVSAVIGLRIMTGY